MNQKETEYTIILASESPRRRHLLEDARIAFKVVPSRIDEDSVDAVTPEQHARTLAETKAAAVSRLYPNCWIIGGDSIVVIDDTIINKPASRADAYKILSSLSGRTHRVITGYSIQCLEKEHFHSHACITEVTFKNLSGAEIHWYLDTPEPWDKAGSYAIQGIGAFMVSKINGSWTNVVGLPVCEVVEHLIKYGVISRQPRESNYKNLSEPLVKR